MTRKDLLRITGMSEAEVRHCVRVAAVADRVGMDRLLAEQHRPGR
jgi:hypothetical protein